MMSMMVRQLQAVYEGGVLRPLEPLDLRESQRVHLLMLDNHDPETANARQDRREEKAWLHQHGGEYAGEWVALDGSILIAHGPSGLAAWESARKAGVTHPLIVHLPDSPELPFGGW